MMPDSLQSLQGEPRAAFIPGVAGELLTVYIPPDPAAYRGENVLIVPPFAEEMMRVRRMVSFQARRLSAAGVGTLVVDLFGTGDSAGDFSEARWEIWRSDIASAVDWLRNNEGDAVSLLGIRLGAILAMDFVRENPEINLTRSVFWKPVVNGKTNLREFLLLRVLAGMMQKSMSRVTLDALHASLDNGESVESAGYVLTPELFNDINALDLAPLGTERSAPVHWIEVSPASEDSPEIPGLDVIAEWNERNIETDASVLKGSPFWAEWNLHVVNDLLDKTTDIFGGEES